jgi:hypothetical protein
MHGQIGAEKEGQQHLHSKKGDWTWKKQTTASGLLKKGNLRAVIEVKYRKELAQLESPWHVDHVVSHCLISAISPLSVQKNDYHLKIANQPTLIAE